MSNKIMPVSEVAKIEGLSRMRVYMLIEEGCPVVRREPYLIDIEEFRRYRESRPDRRGRSGRPRTEDNLCL